MPLSPSTLIIPACRAAAEDGDAGIVQLGEVGLKCLVRPIRIAHYDVKIVVDDFVEARANILIEAADVARA